MRKTSQSKENPVYKTKDVTFVNSRDIPFQRWYPYIEGYSPDFVKTIISENNINANLIYEPFAGTGTTIFAADSLGIDSIYSEVNPLLRFLIKTKLDVLGLSKEDRNVIGLSLIERKASIFGDIKEYRPSRKLDKAYKDVFGRSVYFPNETYDIILRLRSFIDDLYKSADNINNRLIADLLTIAVFSCLLPVSFLKKQGDVRFKTDKEKAAEMRSLQDVLPLKISQISEDIINSNYVLKNNHNLAVENAKTIGNYESDRKISAVITSPPYLNGTNYFRNTKLELWFIYELKTKDNLRIFRDEVLTSAICDVKHEYREVFNPVNSPLLTKVLNELETAAYDRRIPLMVKCYFMEMYQLFAGLRKQLDANAKIFIDLGDSIFSGIHIQTDIILIQVLEGIGYVFDNREILRERRSRNGSLLSQVLLSFHV